MRPLSFILVVTLMLWLTACKPAPQQPDAEAAAAASGAYKSCAACHGAQGEGNAGLRAPALVNLDGWYLERQLRHFKAGLRGRHPEDIDGSMMAGQAALLDDAAIDAIVDQIAGFPDVMPAVTLKTDIGNGKQTYEMLCGACHGVEGVGNRVLNAPALRGIDDWYLLGQYEKFRGGLRGTHELDVYGQQMRRMGDVLSEDEARRVVAWLMSLGLHDQ